MTGKTEEELWFEWADEFIREARGATYIGPLSTTESRAVIAGLYRFWKNEAQFLDKRCRELEQKLAAAVIALEQDISTLKRPPPNK
jgi:hypothetical protein